jgi:hypothetical protein
MLRTSTFLLLEVLSLAVSAGTLGLEKDDAALIRYIETTDRTLKNAVGPCFDQKLKRTTVKGHMRFVYTAFCEIKEEEEGECHSYKVRASGIVENNESAMAQKIQLDLLCSKEGD